jgi:hypothetical protein
MPMGWMKSCLFASWAWLAGPLPLLAQGGDTFRPEQVDAREGSLQQSGTVKETAPVDEHAASIPPANPLGEVSAEKPVAIPPPPPVPVARGVPSEVLALDTTMPARVSELLACRLEIATDRRVRLQDVAAGSVLLRWTVQPGGGVTDAETVARRRTDPEVLSCVRRKMEAWLFIRAPGGEPLAIQQTLKFD